ncbi:hypothetical protein K439DRAFT_1638904 [Ramaria rubella]|nr:hypothetical protein K439DRAFT_1638904 [Ramaria rubella]
MHDGITLLHTTLPPGLAPVSKRTAVSAGAMPPPPSHNRLPQGPIPHRHPSPHLLPADTLALLGQPPWL